MSGRLAEAPVIVGRLLFEGDDGIVPVVWIRFPEEPDDAAGAYRVLPGGQFERLDDVGPWAQWKKVAALTGP